MIAIWCIFDKFIFSRSISFIFFSFYFRHKLYRNPQNIPCAPQLRKEPVSHTAFIISLGFLFYFSFSRISSALMPLVIPTPTCQFCSSSNIFFQSWSLISWWSINARSISLILSLLIIFKKWSLSLRLHSSSFIRSSICFPNAAAYFSNTTRVGILIPLLYLGRALVSFDWRGLTPSTTDALNIGAQLKKTVIDEEVIHAAVTNQNPFA